MLKETAQANSQPAAVTAAPLRVGIVGSGFMGAVHARAAHAAGAAVVGVSASSPASAARARDALGAERAFASVDDLLDSGVDVLHVCAPNYLHFDIAISAVRAGVHVVCEKPLTTDLGDAEQLTREAAQQGVVGTVPFVYRFHPAPQVARGRKNRLAIELSGDAHSFAFDQENPESLWRGDELGGRTLVRDPKMLAPDAARLCIVPAGHSQGYQECFNAFVSDTYAAIRGEHREGLPTFRDGLRSVQLVEAVAGSARTGGDWATGLTQEQAA